MGEYSSIVKVDKTEVNLSKWWEEIISVLLSLSNNFFMLISYQLSVKIDTQATPKHDRLRPLCYSLADVFLVCFSIEDPDSYHNVAEKWIPEIRQYYPSVPVLLVGTKRDLRFNDATVTQLLKVDQNPIQYYQVRDKISEWNWKKILICNEWIFFLQDWWYSDLMQSCSKKIHKFQVRNFSAYMGSFKYHVKWNSCLRTSPVIYEFCWLLLEAYRLVKNIFCRLARIFPNLRSVLVKSMTWYLNVPNYKVICTKIFKA